jgi:uncharacterized membrane protein
VAAASAAAAHRDGGDVSLARILRHLASGRVRLRRAFPPPTLSAIERAIREAETGHDGEIVFVVEGALDTTPLLRGQTARQRAIEVFSRMRIWDTEQNNGVLLYVLFADRDVEIVADRGIDARAGEQAWNDICHEMEESFGRGDFQAGSLAGIRAVGEHLRRHFASSGKRRNELPDKPIVS